MPPPSPPALFSLTPPSSTSPVSRHFTSQRLRLHYVDWGNPGAPPLILQHGGQDHCRSWDRTAQALGRDWHVICPDLRGHGDSDWSPDGNYTLPSLAADFSALLDALGHDQVSLVGHSLGGIVGTIIAAIQPGRIRRFVNIEGIALRPPTGAADDDLPWADRISQWIERRKAVLARAPRRFADIAPAIERMRARNPNLDEAQARHLTEHALHRNDDGTLSWKFDPLTAVWIRDQDSEAAYRDIWGRIECPLLLLYGDGSGRSNPAENGRLAYFRNARLITYPEASHWLHHDRFDRFIADTAAFLADGEGPGDGLGDGPTAVK